MRRAFRVCCPQRPMRGARGRLAIAGVGAGALAGGQHAKKALWADCHSSTCRAGAGGAAPDLRAAAFTGPLPNRCAQGSEGDRHLHCIAAPNICRQMSAPGDTRALGESTRQCVVVGNRRRLTHLHEATGTVTAARQPEIGRDLQPQTITEPGPVQSGFALFSGFSLMCVGSVLCHGRRTQWRRPRRKELRRRAACRREEL